MVQDRAIVTTADRYKVNDLSNSALFSDLDLNFKVTPIFDVEYDVNGTTLIDTCLGLEWITSKNLHKPYSCV